MPNFFAIALTAIIGFGIASCGDDNSTSGDPDLSGTITITPSTATVGATLTANYSGGSETVTYQWKRGSTNLGTAVTQLANEAGSYTVTVSATGYKIKTSAAVTVTEDPTKLRLSNLLVTFVDETDETDFSVGFYDFTSGELVCFIETPKVQVTGTGAGRKLTIELDEPVGGKLLTLNNNYLGSGADVTPAEAKIFRPQDYMYTESWFCLELLKLGTMGSVEGVGQLIYVDRDVTINGVTSSNYQYNNVSLSKGWHFLYGPWGDGPVVISTSKTFPTGYTWSVFED
jgi:hypothetical protein